MPAKILDILFGESAIVVLGKKEKIMDKQRKKECFKTLWSLRTMTLKELFVKINQIPELKWAIGLGGFLFLVQEILQYIIGYRVIKLVISIFALVL